MKTKRLWMVVSIFSLAVFSCDCGGGGGGPGSNPGGSNPQGGNNPPGGNNPACSALGGSRIGETKQFWALDDKDRFHSVNAVLRAEGNRSTFWVQKELNVAASVLASFVSEYENKIRPAVLGAFSVQGPIKDPESNEVVAQNSLEWADYLGDCDGKTAILIVDMGDGADSGVITMGYFFPPDLYAKGDPRNLDSQYSNEADMFYINVHALPYPTIFKTLAHEAQHLINFVNSALLRRFHDEDLGMSDWHQMDIWINEGLSSAAEYVYSGQHNEARFDRFNDGLGAIISGNNFFVWGERPDAILDEYATVYLFFQWLRLQAGGDNKIYQDISKSPQFDHQSVVNAIQGKGNYLGESNLQWGTLLRDWLIANLMTKEGGTASPSNRHSYMADPLLSKIQVRLLPSGYDVMELYPGEGVYTFTNAAGRTYGNIANHGPNIRYAAMDYLNGGPINPNGTSFKNGFLLTYNINTVNDVEGDFTYVYEWLNALEKLRERGHISSDVYAIVPSPPNNAGKNMKSFVSTPRKAQPSEPQAISLWDMIRLREFRGEIEAPAFNQKKNRSRKHTEH